MFKVISLLGKHSAYKPIEIGNKGKDYERQSDDL
jgi:hypothetical protein